MEVRHGIAPRQTEYNNPTLFLINFQRLEQFMYRYMENYLLWNREIWIHGTLNAVRYTVVVAVGLIHIFNLFKLLSICCCWRCCCLKTCIVKLMLQLLQRVLKVMIQPLGNMKLEQSSIVSRFFGLYISSTAHLPITMINFFKKWVLDLLMTRRR